GSVARISIGPRTYAKVRRALRRGGYDLLHVHEPLSPSVGLLATTQAGRAGRPLPVVGTFHANLGRSLALTVAGPLLRGVYHRLAARMPGGPASVALRTGATLLPCAVYHDRRPGRWRAVVRPPLAFEPSGDTRSDVAALTQRLAEAFEGLIAAAPTQWHVLSRYFRPPA
ncbi:MAG TPA: glycosyltransferase, partial [Actinomycetes bacterium]|nr:glycosyltransferase [Actinomycetes bacterium]